MFSFDVGDNVRIINENECYVDDPKMVADHIHDPYNLACYCMSSQPCEDDIGKIVAGWEDNGQNIYYVRIYEDDNCDRLSCYCYLMDEAGLGEYEPEIKVGDKVKVVRPGAVYADYVSWVLRNITDPNLLARWACGSRIPENGIYEVVKIALHSEGTSYVKLAFIKDAYGGSLCKCYLVDVDGLTKVKPEDKQKKQHTLEF